MFKNDTRNARFLNSKQVRKKNPNPVFSSLEVNFDKKKELQRSQMPCQHNAAFTYELLVFTVIKDQNFKQDQ